MKTGSLLIYIGLLLICLSVFALKPNPSNPITPVNGSMAEAYYIFGHQKRIIQPHKLNPGQHMYLKKDHPASFWKEFWDLHFTKKTQTELEHYQGYLQSLPYEFPKEAKIYRSRLTNYWQSYKQEVDTLSELFQKSGVEINFINNSADTIYLQSQLDFPICIKEVRDEKGRWRAIEFVYQIVRGCFGSLEMNYFPISPYKAWSILTYNKHEGPFQTEIRYKILGKDQFYYSPTFKGNINLQDFILSESKRMTTSQLPVHTFCNWVEGEFDCISLTNSAQ